MGTKRIERLLKLIQALQTGQPLTVGELGRSAKVSRRTIFRDLELLSRAGISFTYDRISRRYATDRNSLLPPVTLSHREAFALMLAIRYLVRRRVFLDASEAISLGVKLESLLPAAFRDTFGSPAESVDVRDEPASDPSSIADTLPILQQAIRQQKKIRMRYDSYADRKVIHVILHPYRQAFIHRGWYVIGWCEPFAQVRTFKIERIVQLGLMDEPFQIDPTFSLDEYFGNAWLMIRGNRTYHVRIRFLPRVAGNVDEVIWHKTQRTTTEADGCLLFEADVDGVDEIAWWILGYGDQARVLGPPELREKILEHAQGMSAYYRGLTV